MMSCFQTLPSKFALNCNLRHYILANDRSNPPGNDALPEVVTLGNMMTAISLMRPGPQVGRRSFQLDPGFSAFRR